MRNIRIEPANGRSMSEELQTATKLLDDAGISYSVNIVVAAADEHAATLIFHDARVRFIAGYTFGDPYGKSKAKPTRAN